MIKLFIVLALFFACVITLNQVECRPGGTGKYEVPVGVSQDEEWEYYKV